jgi:hypothetical protein
VVTGGKIVNCSLLTGGGAQLAAKCAQRMGTGAIILTGRSFKDRRSAHRGSSKALWGAGDRSLSLLASGGAQLAIECS